jgi:hypothetical protein
VAVWLCVGAGLIWEEGAAGSQRPRVCCILFVPLANGPLRLAVLGLSLQQQPQFLVGPWVRAWAGDKDHAWGKFVSPAGLLQLCEPV